VEVRTYNVIYELTNDVRAAMAGLLEPVYEEEKLGTAEVRAVFRVPNTGIVAGCYVTEGRVVRNEYVRVKRKGEIIFSDGKLDSLKHLKDEVREMAQGFECGIFCQAFQDFEVGDIIEVYTKKRVARTI
jgi:translation initiation factor IF-2